jgi:hypothetical protein
MPSTLAPSRGEALFQHGRGATHPRDPQRGHGLGGSQSDVRIAVSQERRQDRQSGRSTRAGERFHRKLAPVRVQPKQRELHCKRLDRVLAEAAQRLHGCVAQPHVFGV